MRFIARYTELQLRDVMSEFGQFGAQNDSAFENRK